MPNKYLTVVSVYYFILCFVVCSVKRASLVYVKTLFAEHITHDKFKLNFNLKGVHEMGAYEFFVRLMGVFDHVVKYFTQKYMFLVLLYLQMDC